MKEMPLTKGLYALVDDEDFEYLNQWKWHAQKRGVGMPEVFDARRKMRTPNGRIKYITMAAVLLNLPDGMESDHRDRNPLNNQRANLRPATRAQNASNRGKPVNNTSGYKGVTLCRKSGKYRAVIRAGGVIHRLGFFVDKRDAALAYNEAAKHFNGEFAYLNEIL